MSKPVFAYAKTMAHISCVVTVQLISTFVFATEIVQSLFFSSPKPSSVAIQPGLCWTWAEIPKTSFLALRLSQLSQNVHLVWSTSEECLKSPQVSDTQNIAVIILKFEEKEALQKRYASKRCRQYCKWEQSVLSLHRLPRQLPRPICPKLLSLRRNYGKIAILS